MVNVGQVLGLQDPANPHSYSQQLDLTRSLLPWFCYNTGLTLNNVQLFGLQAQNNEMCSHDRPPGRTHTYPYVHLCMQVVSNGSGFLCKYLQNSKYKIKLTKAWPVKTESTVKKHWLSQNWLLLSTSRSASKTIDFLKTMFLIIMVNRYEVSYYP